MPQPKQAAVTQPVETNLKGVRSDVHFLNITADLSGIASLVHPDMLPRLQAAHAPGPRAFLEKLLAPQWRPENQITPQFTPKIGVTNRLTPRRATAEASFTASNWAGGTIKGNFTAAFGIWRVPTVVRPAMPPGTDGGWDSSSWVGIDGTYGSTDVLQAGVRQGVDGNGSASYFPWFEWFVPMKAVLSDTSPLTPGLASLNGRMYIAWKGDSNDNLNVSVSNDNGQTFGKKFISGEISEVAPALAAHNGNLYVAWKGNDNDQINVAIVEMNAAGDPTGFSQKVVLGETTPLSPSLASVNGNLYLAWRGDSNDQLNIVISLDNGNTFGGKLIAGDTSTEAPVLGTLDGNLMIAWKGDGNDNLNVARVNTNPAPTGFSNTVTLGETSPKSPALAELSGQLFLGWKGDSNDQLNLLSSPDGQNFGNKLVSFETSQEAPSLVSHNGTIFMGWQGEGDENLNVADLAQLQNPPPAYVNETRIDNMEIEPGDELFCAISYVGQQGKVLFGNNTRGNFFNIVLDPPPGATFSGNSVEWIMEAPDSGEPGTALPRFSPVIFSTAFAMSAAGNFIDPVTGDTNNILVFGSLLTSVSLKQDFVEIDYAPTWAHNLPGAAVGAVPVQPGTSPTSWYTTPENVQHIAYVGDDMLIHELFYFIGGDGAWHHNLPSAAPGSVQVQPGTSPTSWYTTPENVQHIAYVGNDMLIHELFYFIGGDGVWHHNLPSAAPGSVQVQPGTSPTSWYTTPENVQHIAYVGTDSLIHELFFVIGGDGAWHHNLPSAAPGSVQVQPGTSPTSWYTTPENVQHIAYVGTDSLIHELFFVIEGDGAWHHNLPSAAPGSVQVQPGTSPTSWYTTPENVQHIAYVGNDMLIHELFYFIGGDGAWHHNLPSAAPGSVPVQPGTSPTSWYTTPENVQHIAYVGNDMLIHELFYFIGGDGAWHHNLPSAAPGSVPVQPGTSPTSWYTTPEDVEHIGYVGNDKTIHELFFRVD